jgi:flagellar motility protein MotE (MotC chaperone)
MTQATAGRRQQPESGGAPRRLPGLSWLLLITAVALLLPMAGRAPELASALRSQLAVAPPRPLPRPGPPDAAREAGVPVTAAALVEPGAGPAGAMPDPPAPAHGVDGPHTVEALEDFATELGRRQARLAEREQVIALREAAVKLVEERIGEQIARLERLGGELERLLGQASEDEKARIAQLVKVYEAMKAKNAALIFEPMGLDLLLPIVRGMRDTKIAAIVAEMDPAKARALTAELARARELPAPP